MKRLAFVILTSLSMTVFSEDISTTGWRLWPDREAT
jgi:hypothetical protein